MSFQLQQTIKNNAQQLKQYVNDLYEWQRQMQLKQRAKAKQKQSNQNIKNVQNQNLRQKKIEQEATQAESRKKQIHQRKKQMIRDANTVQEYYKAWDNYNPDQQIKILEQQQKRPYRPYNPYEDSKNNLRAKAKTQMVIRGSRNIIKDPTSLKDKGNVHFKVCQYQRAISYYSQCISKILNQQDSTTQNNKKLLGLVYSNRAMSFLKLNQKIKALNDCNQSIKYDNSYSKTYLRRAQCYKKLGKYADSLKDYKKIKQLNPNQNDINTQIKNIQQFLKKRIKQTQQSMIITSIPKALQGGFRIPIEQVDQFTKEDIVESSEKTINYLQQL